MTDVDDAFPFEVGDTVLVRAREHGTSGRILAKFEAECLRITGGGDVIAPSPQARFDMPFGVMNSVSIHPYEADFEVVDND